MSEPAEPNAPGAPACSLEDLEKEYSALVPLATRFANEIERQLSQLIEEHGILLSLPIQLRVKLWSSIRGKLERKSLTFSSITGLDDLVGLRVIAQFTRDVETIRELVRSNFEILEEADTTSRLDEDQFGYSSVHFVLVLPQKWLAVPTLAAMGSLRAEVQLRTTAQHIWAAASHSLQYKHEASVPKPVRRAIHRVSALLETVDLELARVLEQRDTYRSSIVPDLGEGTHVESLNVDSLASILEATFPPVHKGDEDYDYLLADLQRVGLTDPRELAAELSKHRDAALAEDARIVGLLTARAPGAGEYEADASRLAYGVFYTHTGLARFALGFRFGPNWHMPDDLFAEFQDDA